MWRRIESSELERFPVGRNLPEGSSVEVSMSERSLVLGALLAHGLPLALLLAGAAAAALVARSDLAVLLGAAIATALGIALTPRLRRRVERAALGSLEIRPLA
jgi:positive regulator of sigma E activity